MMRSRSFMLTCVLLASVAVLAACGGGPTSPSEQGVVLRGLVEGRGAAAATAFGAAQASDEPIIVTVQEDPSITTTVGADGSFTLRGLPEGSFTLVFTQGATTIGTLTFGAVKPNQEIIITVAVADDGTVVLVEEKRNGIGHGDLEIEGTVESAAPDPAGDSTFVIDGHTVIARPGQTAIREGNKKRTVNDVTVGRQVHVKGVWLDPLPDGSQQVLAHEIKLQDDVDDDEDEDEGEDDDDDEESFCPDAGKKAEVEGKITAKGAADITVTQQGKGDFLADVDSGTKIRKGNTTYTFEQLLVGWRVHVKGSSLGLSGAACHVDASEVKVQQN